MDALLGAKCLPDKLQKALKEDKVAHVDTSTHTNRVHEAVNMVHEIVRRGAFSMTDACSSTTSLTFVPKPPSLAKNGLASTAESLIFSDSIGFGASKFAFDP